MLKRPKVVTILLAILGGISCGFVLSTIIGAVGFLIFDRAIGIRYLPLIMAIIFAGIAAWAVRKKERSEGMRK